MSADLLRRAAALMRADYEREDVDDLEAALFHLAVADWLDWTADCGLERNREAALPVARAYLGEQA